MPFPKSKVKEEKGKTESKPNPFSQTGKAKGKPALPPMKKGNLPPWMNKP